MATPAKASVVRRWGGRAVGLAVTGIGMYVVAPSLVSMFGSWPQLAHVKIRWFVVLALLETGSFAALWWLARISLTPEGEGARPGVGWGTTATAQLAGNAAAKVIPGGAAAGSVVQGR